MEQPNNDKRRSGQSVAFYTALAVCLIAVGVGTWQLLQPQEDASSVSSAVSLPGEASQRPEIPVTGEASLPVAGPEPSETDGEPETEDVSTLKPATKSDDAASETSPDSASGESKASSDSKSSGGKASSGGSKASSDTKSSGGKASSGESKTSSDTKSGGNKASSSESKTSSDSKSSGSKASSDTKSAKPSGDAVRPVEGQTVTGFSMDKLLYNETMRDWRTHDGVDIAADAGTAVVAVMSGTVESAAADPIMGVTVVIRHADKWESVYSSLTDMPEVEAGDEVTAGQVIGYVGETAASESALGPHLHFSVLNDGAPVDPEAFLP